MTFVLLSASVQKSSCVYAPCIAEVTKYPQEQEERHDITNTPASGFGGKTI